jgi:flagellar biosynthesis protein FlhB
MKKANNKIRKNMIIGFSIFLLLLLFVVIINLIIIPKLIENPDLNFPYPQVFSEVAGNYLFLCILGIGMIILIIGFIDFFSKKKIIRSKLHLEK